MSLSAAYQGKTICVTGHTGFKGSWLTEWLLLLGARVIGYSLPEPPTTPSHFELLQTGERLTANLSSDVRTLGDLQEMVEEYQPDFIFHLAAQPLVRRAYEEPRYTVETNVMGSVNILEAARRSKKDCVVIMITTDKVYENSEWVHAYRENDPLGGFDLYSASKACAEIAISAYRRSFFERLRPSPQEPVIAVATVRGGNVIGGGDWAEDRIVPDCMRHLASGTVIPVRNPAATRPWQHVLELLSGYLQLGAQMSSILRAAGGRDSDRLRSLCSAFNFGPHVASTRTVLELVQEILKTWPGRWQDFTEPDAGHEAGRLSLAIDKAHHTLGWQPCWSFEETVKHTTDWYLRYYGMKKPDRQGLRELTRRQINSYMQSLETRKQAGCNSAA